jgi:hypothetical protein
MDDIVVEIQKLQTGVQASEVWAQKVSQEAKSLGLKLDSFQDSQLKRLQDLEENVCRRVQKAVNEGVDSISNSTMEQNSAFVIQMNTALKNSSALFGKVEQNVLQMTRDLKEECAREISNSIGAIGNSLSLQLESLKSAQHGQHVESEKAVKCMVENMMQQAQYDAERLKRMEANIMESADRATRAQLEGLKDFQKRFELSMQDQHELTKKNYTTMNKVLDFTGETNSRAIDHGEKISTLSQLLGVCREGERGLQSPSERRHKGRSGRSGSDKEYEEHRK